MPTPIEKQIPLPLTKAIGIAFKSLRARFVRSLLTLITIAMAIALVTNIALTRSLEPASQTAPNSPARTLWLLSLSLLVCAVGISNAMLMSVMERFREIGTMKCLGALDSFILKLFFFESLFLGLAGSLAGVIVGLVLTLLQLLFKHGSLLWNPRATVNTVFITTAATLLGVVITAAAAAYPSWKAARMNPIEAMRIDV